jgi:hypothetical protein
VRVSLFSHRLLRLLVVVVVHPLHLPLLLRPPPSF